MPFHHSMLKFNDRLELASLNAPVVKIGEKGQAVRLVQQALILLVGPLPKSTAEDGSPDGEYGAETLKVVKAFQGAVGLKKDGRVGTDTLAAMDAQLMLRKVKFDPLPPIPGLESDTDSLLESSTRVVYDTLLSCPLAPFNFHLQMTVLEQHRQEDTYIHGTSFQRMARAVQDGEITVAFCGPGDPQAVAALYDIDTDTIQLAGPLSYDQRDKCLVVHEAAHAICDWKGKPLNAMFSEAVGFVAESLYMLQTVGSPKQVSNHGANNVYKKAFEIAKTIAGGKSPAASAVEELAKSIKHTEYGEYSLGTHQFNGRSR